MFKEVIYNKSDSTEIFNIITELNNRHSELINRIKLLEEELAKIKSEPRVINNYYTYNEPTYMPPNPWGPNPYQPTWVTSTDNKP